MYTPRLIFENILLFHPNKQSSLLLFGYYLHNISMQQMLFFGVNMKKLSKEEVKDLFSDNGCELLGDYIGCGISMTYRCKCGTVSSISLDKFRRRLLRKEGCWNCNRHEWTSEEDEILRSLYGVESRNQILNKLPGIDLVMLKSRAHKLGLKGNRNVVLKKARKGRGRKYSFDFDYFDSIDIIRSYWAGFIASNGCVNHERKCISIGLSEKDIDHLTAFQDAVLHTGVIYRVVSKNGESQASVCFYGADKWLVGLEKNYCIFATNPPVHLDETNALAYIVGCIDGDGYISNKIDSNDFHIQITGAESILLWIKEIFDKLCPAINKRYAEVFKTKKGCFAYNVSGRRAKYLIKRMMEFPLPRLKRKWEIYNAKKVG